MIGDYFNITILKFIVLLRSIIRAGCWRFSSCRRTLKICNNFKTIDFLLSLHNIPGKQQLVTKKNEALRRRRMGSKGGKGDGTREEGRKKRREERGLGEEHRWRIET